MQTLEYTQQLLDEIHVLNSFDLHSMQQGIKVHSDAGEGLLSACQRLYDKGLIDRNDGGYLTHRGVEAAKHAKILLDALSPCEETSTV